MGSTKKGSTMIQVMIGLFFLMSLFTVIVKSVSYTSKAKQDITKYYTLRIMEELFLYHYLAEIREKPATDTYQTIRYNTGEIRYKIESEKIIYEVYDSKQKLYRKYQIMNEK